MLIANILPLTSENSLSVIGYQNIVFDSNEEKTITFTAPVDLAPEIIELQFIVLMAPTVGPKLCPMNHLQSHLH